MNSPNATVYRLRGVWLILDDLAYVDHCEEPPTCLQSAPAADRMLAVGGRAQEARQRIRVETALHERQHLQATRIQSCSLLAVIAGEMVRARLADDYGTRGRCVVPRWVRQT